ncbi:unnamed protein product [Bemisia tabaci]|uniref:Enoyl reductase (ER) domain-containing protein n=1 Tax=Bemisia tabaci TaxID=7038 RepID=A0A9P0F461_BEMTA|nr:unnamed protein product [Bemisia tabaci]
MDEAWNQLSSKLEALQALLLVAIQSGQTTLTAIADQGHGYVVDILASPRIIKTQELASNAITSLLDALDHAQQFSSQYISSIIVLCSNSQLFHNKLSRSTICAGCVGLVIGSGIGLIIGLNLKVALQPASSMRAVAATNFSGIDAVALLEDVFTPTISAPDEVLIHVRAASIDTVDIMIAGGYARTLRKQLNKYNSNVSGELPVILGRDCSGIVMEMGHEVRKFDIGDEVWAAVPPWAPGTLAEFVVVKQHFVSRKPKCLGFEGSATLPYSGCIAWHAVVNKAGLSGKSGQGKRVLVHCGSSSIGVLIVQLCRYFGAHITVTSVGRVSSFMAELGADEVLPLEVPDIEKQLAKMEKFSVIFNTAGSVAHQFCLQLCSSDGMVISTVNSPLPSDSFGIFLGSLYSIWIRITHGIFGCNSWNSVTISHSVLEELSLLVDRGHLRPVVDRVFSPQHADQAIHYVDSLLAFGKTVIRFSHGDGSGASTKSEAVG